MNLVCTSMERYNGGAAAKRLYGSSTITRFCVHRVEDSRDPSRWVYVDVGGSSPSARKAAAALKAVPLIEQKLAGR